MYMKLGLFFVLAITTLLLSEAATASKTGSAGKTRWRDRDTSIEVTCLQLMQGVPLVTPVQRLKWFLGGKVEVKNPSALIDDMLTTWERLGSGPVGRIRAHQVGVETRDTELLDVIDANINDGGNSAEVRVDFFSLNPSWTQALKLNSILYDLGARYSEWSIGYQRKYNRLLSLVLSNLSANAYSAADLSAIESLPIIDGLSFKHLRENTALSARQAFEKRRSDFAEHFKQLKEISLPELSHRSHVAGFDVYFDKISDLLRGEVLKGVSMTFTLPGFLHSDRPTIGEVLAVIDFLLPTAGRYKDIASARSEAFSRTLKLLTDYVLTIVRNNEDRVALMALARTIEENRVWDQVSLDSFKMKIREI